jgi:hypothetical protein
MTESEREKKFPIHIELGKTAEIGELAMNTKSESKGKTKKYYPSFYISDVEGLEGIPEEGCVLIDFKRRSINVRTDQNGKTTTSVELEIHTICMPDDYESEGDMGDVVDKMIKKSNSKKSEEDDEDDNE